MANTIKLLRSTTAGAVPSSLVSGQLAINESDGRIYYRNGSGTVTQFSSIASYATAASFPASGASSSVLYLASDSSRLFQFVGGVYVELGVAGGGTATTSASDLTSGTLPDARLSATVTAALTNARTPTSHASSHATGGTDALTLAASQITGLPTAGTGSTNYCAGNDSRLSDSRTAVAHASSHATGGSDAITPASIGAAAASHIHSAADITSGTLDAARLPGSAVLTNDARLSDSRSPTSHVHGNITNAGAIGSTTGQVVVTTNSGVLTTAGTISASTQVSGLASVATSGSAADLTGTLADARLSSNIPTWATIATSQHQPASTLDIFPRGEATSAGIAQGSGSIFFTFFTPSVSFTVSSITMVAGTTAASGLTLARMGIYTMDETTATLVARTASDTTLFSSVSTAYTRSLSTAGGGGFPATYTLNAGSRYAVAVICVSTTAPLYAGRLMNAAVSALSPRINSTLASQTDLVTSTTTFSTAQGQPWARLT